MRECVRFPLSSAPPVQTAIPKGEIKSQRRSLSFSLPLTLSSLLSACASFSHGTALSLPSCWLVTLKWRLSKSTRIIKARRSNSRSRSRNRILNQFEDYSTCAHQFFSFSSFLRLPCPTPPLAPFRFPRILAAAPSCCCQNLFF